MIWFNNASLGNYCVEIVYVSRSLTKENWCLTGNLFVGHFPKAFWIIYGNCSKLIYRKLLKSNFDFNFGVIFGMIMNYKGNSKQTFIVSIII